MRPGSHANALLVELLFVIFFFMIGSTLVVRVFEKAWKDGQQAQTGTYALSEAQNIADCLFMADDVDGELQKAGFTWQKEGTCWLRSGEGYELRVVCEQKKTARGTLRQAVVSALADGKELFGLPCTRYLDEADGEKT